MKYISTEEVIHGVRFDRDRINSIDGRIGLSIGQGYRLPESSGEVRVETFVGKCITEER